MFELLTEKDFDGFFEIMEYSFPENERRSRENQLALFSDSRYKVAGIKDCGGNVCAFIAYWEEGGVTFLEHFAVAEDLRGSGLGGKFLDEFLKDRKKPVVLEVELPENEIAARRIGFYQRHNFVLNDFTYFQPPLGEGKKGVPLKIMSLESPLGQKEAEFVRKTLLNIYNSTSND